MKVIKFILFQISVLYISDVIPCYHSDPCGSHGTCRAGGVDELAAVCVCDEGWDGDSCTGELCVRCVLCVSDVCCVCQMCHVCQMCVVCVRCVSCVSDVSHVCQMCLVCVRCVLCVSDVCRV